MLPYASERNSTQINLRRQIIFFHKSSGRAEFRHSRIQRFKQSLFLFLVLPSELLVGRLLH